MKVRTISCSGFFESAMASSRAYHSPGIRTASNSRARCLGACGSWLKLPTWIHVERARLEQHNGNTRVILRHPE